jgi:hypothetical protein
VLFKDYHIGQIRAGEKTVTRREWKENYNPPNVGTVVAAKTEMLKPDAECDCFIRITGKRRERLGDITPESARREGDYDGIEEFRAGYEAVYGDDAWDDDKVVTVVEFEYVGRSRPGACVAKNGDRFGYSQVSDTWYRIDEFDDHGDGKITAKSKTEIDRAEVPEACLEATEERALEVDSA